MSGIHTFCTECNHQSAVAAESSGSDWEKIYRPNLESNRRHNKRRRANGGTCPSGLRKRVISAFSGVCQYCGWHPSMGWAWKLNYLTVDRLVPGTEGGRYVPENVTLACLYCNSRRQNGSVYGPARPLSVMEASRGR